MSNSPPSTWALALALSLLVACSDGATTDVSPGDGDGDGDGDGNGVAGSLDGIDTYDCGDFCSTDPATEVHRCGGPEQGVCSEFDVGHHPAEAHKDCFDLRPELVLQPGACAGGSSARCEFPPDASRDYLVVQHYYQGFQGADLDNPDDVAALEAVCIRGLYGLFYTD